MCGEQPDNRVPKDLQLSRDQKAGQRNQQALPNSPLGYSRKLNSKLSKNILQEKRNSK